MQIEQLAEFVRRKPFVPFRIYVSDGATYDIRHPEAVLPTVFTAFIGLTTDPARPYFERAVMVDMMHITRLENIHVPNPTANGQ